MSGMAATRAISLRTEVPGPRSREILARKQEVVADPLSVLLPVVVAEGHGSTITDVDALVDHVARTLTSGAPQAGFQRRVMSALPDRTPRLWAWRVLSAGVAVALVAAFWIVPR